MSRIGRMNYRLRSQAVSRLTKLATTASPPKTRYAYSYDVLQCDFLPYIRVVL